MNSLSWLIYGADIVHGFTVVFIIFGTMVAIVALVLWIDGACKRDSVPEDYTYNDRAKAEKKENLAMHPMYKLGHRQQYIAYSLVPVIAVCWLLAVAIPSSKAVYMIAASEMGESAYTQFANSDLYKSLKKILENELGALIPQEKPKTTPSPSSGEPT